MNDHEPGAHFTQDEWPASFGGRSAAARANTSQQPPERRTLAPRMLARLGGVGREGSTLHAPPRNVHAPRKNCRGTGCACAEVRDPWSSARGACSLRACNYADRGRRGDVFRAPVQIFRLRVQIFGCPYDAHGRDVRHADQQSSEDDRSGAVARLRGEAAGGRRRRRAARRAEVARVGAENVLPGAVVEIAATCAVVATHAARSARAAGAARTRRATRAGRAARAGRRATTGSFRTTRAERCWAQPAPCGGAPSRVMRSRAKLLVVLYVAFVGTLVA